MITKEELMNMRQGLCCLVPRPGSTQVITCHEYDNEFCDCQILKLLDHIEKQDQDIKTLTEIVERVNLGCSFPENEVQKAIRDETRKALDKVYGEKE